MTDVMTTPAEQRIPGDWHDGALPENVLLGADTYVETSYSFTRCRSETRPAIRVGRSTGIYRGSMFDLGPAAMVTIGDYVLLHGARIIADSAVRIGDYTMISWRVVIMDTYRVSAARDERRAQLRSVAQHPDRELGQWTAARPVDIGTNVWIGFDTCILPGVSIGDGAVVGARSVVREDVPAGAVVAGNPAQIIRPGEQQR